MVIRRIKVKKGLELEIAGLSRLLKNTQNSEAQQCLLERRKELRRIDKLRRKQLKVIAAKKRDGEYMEEKNGT